MTQLTREPIDTQLLIETVRHPHAGGVALFLGTVREWTGEIRTANLEYEALEPMALAKMNQLEQEARAKWPIQGVAIIHRLGVLGLGEIAVGVAVSCPHRAEAFEACRYLIDRLKEIVPIWKREESPDGGGGWVHPV
jgi:molybdopterin synthase catalytic subunit